MPDYVLQSVDNALRIIETLTESGPELGVSELSRQLGLGRSTVHRLLATLEARGFVSQNPATTKYKLGIKLVNVSAVILRQMNIITEAKPYLKELSATTGEAAHLGLLNRDEIVFVDKVHGSNPAKMTSVVGLSKPAHITSIGKVLLANTTADRIDHYLQRINLQPYTPHSIIDKAKLKEELERIRATGHGEDQQESEEGLVCFAAPIRNIHGEAIAAISVSGAASCMNERKPELIACVKKTAEELSLACGWLKQS